MRCAAFKNVLKSNLKKQAPSAACFSSKIYPNAAAALEGFEDGMLLAAGGFGLSGIPETLIEGIVQKGTKDIVVASNNAGVDNFGLGKLLATKQIKRMKSSYVGENAEFERQYISGELEVELIPQGTLAEKLRAGGAGIPAFFTPTGANTLVSDGGFPIKNNPEDINKPIIASEAKEVRTYNGRPYVLEDAIFADFSIVKAYNADKSGNLQYRLTARNFNADCAKAGRVTIAEAENIVETGELNADYIHTPGIYVQRLINAELNEKRIERVTLSTGKDIVIPGKPEVRAKREKIIKRAAKEIKDGMYLNLGIGMPTLVPNFTPNNMEFTLQSENGLLGFGPYPTEGNQDADLINAGKETITLVPGSSTFPSSESFAMIRGAHVDLTVLGGLQVAANGDLANWIIPGKMVKGMGGAMDLVSSGARVVVTMEHTAKGNHKILDSCSLPVTGRNVVDRLITEMGVFDFPDGKITLVEIASDVTLEDVKAATGCDFAVSPDLKPMDQ